jgi:hypothetical protein
MCAREREGRIIVIEGNVLPTAGGMASRTDGTKLTIVYISGSMAREAILRRAFVYVVDMAGLAGSASVQAIERKPGLAVIENYLRPFGRLVTGTAVCAKLTLMNIFGGMACETILRRPFIYIVDMTGLTGYSRMGACQRESGLAVIKGHIFPTAGGVAGGTFRTKLTLVHILRRMARKTVFRRAFENTVEMTGCTGEIGVQAVQRKCSFAVIEAYLLPAAGSMAGGTFRTELSFVHILPCMTGKTVFWCTFKGIVNMAGFTGNPGV